MDFTSKLSLYDILTQLISGFLILALFIPMPTNGGETVTGSYNWIFLLIFSYLIGIIYHRLLEWIRNIFDKGCKECYIKLWFPTIFKRNYKLAIINVKTSKEDNELKDYYNTYYSVMDKPSYNTIMFLEAQEAFLRDITWVLVIYLIFYHSEIKFFEGNLFAKIFFINPITDCNFLILITNIVVFVLPILFARYQTQMKVYKVVWEAGKYK